LYQPLNINCSKDTLIRFCGLADYFQRLAGREGFLYQQLHDITLPAWRRLAEQPLPGPIGIHIRRGDFATPRSPEELHTKGAVRTPLSWFRETLAAIRRAVGYRVGAYVVSDGSAKELAELLQLENVALVRTGSAIGDLLVLTRAKVLLGLGGSSFSAWASFMGQMPTVTVPGQSLTWFKLVNTRENYLGEFEPADPDQDFLRQVQIVLPSVN
jgi:hypothetical protein